MENLLTIVSITLILEILRFVVGKSLNTIFKTKLRGYLGASIIILQIMFFHGIINNAVTQDIMISLVPYLFFFVIFYFSKDLKIIFLVNGVIILFFNIYLNV